MTWTTMTRIRSVAAVFAAAAALLTGAPPARAQSESAHSKRGNSGLPIAAMPTSATPVDAGARPANIRVPFVLNQGQMDQRVKFYAKAFGGAAYVTRQGEIVYALPTPESKNATRG